jgi:hypothetical protein
VGNVFSPLLQGIPGRRTHGILQLARQTGALPWGFLARLGLDRSLRQWEGEVTSPPLPTGRRGQNRPRAPQINSMESLGRARSLWQSEQAVRSSALRLGHRGPREPRAPRINSMELLGPGRSSWQWEQLVLSSPRPMQSPGHCVHHHETPPGAFLESLSRGLNLGGAGCDDVGGTQLLPRWPRSARWRPTIGQPSPQSPASRPRN